MIPFDSRDADSSVINFIFTIQTLIEKLKSAGLSINNATHCSDARAALLNAFVTHCLIEPTVLHHKLVALSHSDNSETTYEIIAVLNATAKRMRIENWQPIPKHSVPVAVAVAAAVAYPVAPAVVAGPVISIQPARSIWPNFGLTRAFYSTPAPSRLLSEEKSDGFFLHQRRPVNDRNNRMLERIFHFAPEIGATIRSMYQDISHQDLDITTISQLLAQLLDSRSIIPSVYLLVQDKLQSNAGQLTSDCLRQTNDLRNEFVRLCMLMLRMEINQNPSEKDLYEREIQVIIDRESQLSAASYAGAAYIKALDDAMDMVLSGCLNSQEEVNNFVALCNTVPNLWQQRAIDPPEDQKNKTVLFIRLNDLSHWCEDLDPTIRQTIKQVITSIKQKISRLPEAIPLQGMASASRMARARPPLPQQFRDEFSRLENNYAVKVMSVVTPLHRKKSAIFGRAVEYYIVRKEFIDELSGVHSARNKRRFV